MAANHFRVLLLGAGSGGIATASRLLKTGAVGRVGIIEPSTFHYYQPLWTLVGGGIVKKEQTQKLMKDLIPQGAEWIQDRVKSVDPKLKVVHGQSGQSWSYDYLVIATGLQLDFGKIKGLEGQIGKNGICSIYQYEDAEVTAKMLGDFKGGTAIFTMPPVPIKCAGAPQKIMYLADEIFRKKGVRDKSQVHFMTAGKVIFGVPSFAATLVKVAARKNIQVHYSHKLIEVIPSEKVAVFEKSIDGASPEIVRMKFDLLHVVPPMSAHAYIRDSGLAFADGAQAGWLKVDQKTLQHLDHPDIFGIGDVTGVPNSKTGAAIRKQAPVVAQNLIEVMSRKAPTRIYDGYSSCPLITGFGKVVLAEFGYDGKLMPTFPMDMTKERRSMWHLKKDLLPVLYWKGMMRGRA